MESHTRDNGPLTLIYNDFTSNNQKHKAESSKPLSQQQQPLRPNGSYNSLCNNAFTKFSQDNEFTNHKCTMKISLKRGKPLVDEW